MKVTYTLEVLAHNVRRMRKTNGWTLPELARRASLPKSTVSNIENCKTDPQLSTIASLCCAFQISPHELVKEGLLP